MASGTALAVSFAAGAGVPAALIDVGQQRQLASPLDRARDLHLMAAAGARDPPRADLALLGDELPQGGDVLVVDLLHLLTAVLARLAPAAAGPALLVTPANRLATARLGHQLRGLRSRAGMAAAANTRNLAVQARTECRRRRPRRRPVRAGNPLRRQGPRRPRRLRCRLADLRSIRPRRLHRAIPGTAPNRQ